MSLHAFSNSDSVIHAVDLSGLSARGDTRQQTGEPGRRSGVESLSEIANISGGRLFKDTNDLGVAFEEILEMSSHYYLLAFEPQQLKGPGKFHKLRVRVKPKALKVSHRGGYYERAPFSERTTLARQFEAAEVISKGTTGGDFDLRAMAVPYRSEAGKLLLPIVLEIDGPTLLRAVPGRLSLEIYGYAIDAQGGVLDFMAVVSNLDRERLEHQLSARGLQVHGTFAVEPGRHSLRFLVRDGESGRSASYWMEVDVPPFDPRGVTLYPPLFMDERESWVVLEAATRSGARPANPPFAVADDLFAPRARPQVANGEKQQVCLLAFDGGARYDPGASFEIRPALLDSGGQPVGVGGFKLERAVNGPDGFRRFVLNFTPADLAAGDYTLRVRLRDPASGRISEAYQAIRLR
jgi:hypothetical protein